METIPNLNIYPHVLLHDFLRYFLVAGMAYLVFWKWGRERWKHLIIQDSLPQARKLWFEFRYSLSTVVIFSLVGFSIVLWESAGFTMIYHEIDQFGWIYFLVSILLAIIIHDAYFYWTHRGMHHPRIYKYVHKVHHQSTNPSPWAAYSFHPLEALIQAGFYPILLICIPLHPLAMFIFMVFMISRNVLAHLGFEIFPVGLMKSKWLNWHTTPTHHNLHHRYFHHNYGFYFTWWDNLMGTTQPQYKATFMEVRSRKGNCSCKRKFNTKRVRSKIIQCLILIGWGFSAIAQSATGNWISRDEQTGHPRAIIHIDSSTNGIEGKISKLLTLPYEGTDPVCLFCSGERKNKKVIGMTILWGFKPQESEWAHGKILDPANGEIYQSKLWLENDTLLKIRGYAGPLNLFYRTQTWVRSNDHFSPGSPEGIWKTIDDQTGLPKSMVELRIENHELTGIVAEIFLLPHEGPNQVCDRCEGKWKDQKIEGMKILWGFDRREDKWANGKILDPANGQIYRSYLWLTQKDELKVRGYLGPFFRTQTWERVSPASAYYHWQIPQ